MHVVIHACELFPRIRHLLHRFEEADNLSWGVADCQVGVFRGEQQADFQQVGYEVSGKMLLMASDGGEDKQVAFLPIIAHAGGAAVADIEPAIARKSLQRFAQGGACDTQFLGQLAFRW